MNSKQILIPLKDTKQFGRLFLDYLSNENKLKKFYADFPDNAGIENYLNTNKFSYVNRNLLVSELKEQNKNINISKLTQSNINALEDNQTFTVTTGHQLCLFTGPLFFIYKILSVINYCEYLNQKFSTKKFVPVYWLASEDHDFEEINHAHIYSKNLQWKTSQTGKVGKFKTEGIDVVISEFEQIAGAGENANKIIGLLKESYSKETLAEATRYLVNELFGQFGLVIVDGDSKNFKKEFSGEIAKELVAQFSYQAVSQTNKSLLELNYDTQVNPRNINLFYAKEHIRERIEYSEEHYKINNTLLSFTETEIKELVKNEPEVFSPNVVLRPAYQQKILPNIAYVGGPGELSYWLQLKQIFDQTKIHFPLLVPRKFIMLFDENTLSKLTKNGLSQSDVFLSENELVSMVLEADRSSIDLSRHKEALKKLFADISNDVSNVDKTLIGTTEAELQKAIKGIETIEQKINKALKQKNDTAINQIKSVIQKLFPDGSSQERHDNFISYFIKSDNFIDSIKSSISMDPDEMDKYLLLNI